MSPIFPHLKSTNRLKLTALQESRVFLKNYSISKTFGSPPRDEGKLKSCTGDFQLELYQLPECIEVHQNRRTFFRTPPTPPYCLLGYRLRLIFDRHFAKDSVYLSIGLRITLPIWASIKPSLGYVYIYTYYKYARSIHYAAFRALAHGISFHAIYISLTKGIVIPVYCEYRNWNSSLASINIHRW